MHAWPLSGDYVRSPYWWMIRVLFLTSLPFACIKKEQRKALSLKMLYTLPFDLEMCFVITLPEVVLFGLLQPSAQERILDKETGKEQYRGTNQVPTTLLIVHHCDECNIAPALKKYILLEQVVNRHPNKKGQ